MITARNKVNVALDQVSTPFFVIDAPSGSGKTQLPFALRDKELKIVHLVMVNMVESNSSKPLQPIYRHLVPQSEAFQKALRYKIL